MPRAYEVDGKMIKQCNRCKTTKSVEEFCKATKAKDGYQGHCKACQAKHALKWKAALPDKKAYMKWVRSRIPEEKKRKTVKGYIAYYKTPRGREERRKWRARRMLEPEFAAREKERDRLKRQTPEYKARARANAKRKHDTDLSYRIKNSVRSCIIKAITNNQKAGRSVQLLGCSIEEFKRHIESQWKDGMCWKNYGRERGQWSFDHVICCVLFDFTYPSHQHACFHHSNVRPLWHIENVAKNDITDTGRPAGGMTPEEKKAYLISKGFNYLFEPTT